MPHLRAAGTRSSRRRTCAPTGRASPCGRPRTRGDHPSASPRWPAPRPRRRRSPAVQALSSQEVLGRRGPQRGGRRAADPDHDLGDRAVVGEPQRVRDGDAGDVVEATLGDLVEGRQRGQRPRDDDADDQLVRSSQGLPVAGEVVGQPDRPLPCGRDQDQRRVQGEQHGRCVPDRRAGAQVPTQGGGVADQPGRELREQRGQQRHLTGQPGLDLGQGQRGPEGDRVGRRSRTPAARAAGRCRCSARLARA